MHMVHPGDTIHNPVSGETITFTETSKTTGGAYVAYEYRSEVNQPVAPSHFHPVATEEFEVVQGELSVKMKDGIHVYHSGEKLVIPPGVVHTGWNSGKEQLIVQSRITPAMAFEDYYNVAFRQARGGKVNGKGVPDLLQIAVLCQKTKNQMFAPWCVWGQKLFFAVAAPIGRLLGYRSE